MKQLKNERYEQRKPKAWDSVSTVRSAGRPSALRLVEYLFHDFIELHGDRTYGDDKALIGGIGFLDDIPVTVIAQERGGTVEERQARNHAMLHPEGYRKAKRLALQAERFHRPVVCVVDTPGAYPGIGAEERGQAEAIAQCLLCFSALKTPVISIIMGQGGSGGALALSTADRLLMFENATFSVISPEGFASIYWKDASRAKEAAEIMKMTARDIAAFGVVDAIIPEHAGGLQCDPEYSFAIARERLTWMLMDLMQQPPETLVENRRHKLRHMMDLSFV